MEPMSHPSYAVSAPWEACLISATSLSINVMCIIGTLDRARCDSLCRSSPIVIDLARNATGYPQLDGLLTFRFAYIVTETMALMRHHRLGVTPWAGLEFSDILSKGSVESRLHSPRGWRLQEALSLQQASLVLVNTGGTSIAVGGADKGIDGVRRSESDIPVQVSGSFLSFRLLRPHFFRPSPIQAFAFWHYFLEFSILVRLASQPFISISSFRLSKLYFPLNSSLKTQK